MADFLMPALGADMQTGKVVQWRVAPGTRVRPGDVVAVVETHKGAIDVECFLDGVIDDLAPLDTELPVGALLAHVRGVGPEAVSSSAGAAAVASPKAVKAGTPMADATPTLAPLDAHLSASPVARRRAQSLGLSLASIAGSGLGGAITLADVERAAAVRATEPAPPPQPPQVHFDLPQMRQAIAGAMVRSKREIPHYYLGTRVDFDGAQRWLDDYNAERAPPERVLPAALLLKAVARGLAEVPQLNGFFEGGEFRPGRGVHVGWAVALRGGGLIAPAIHHADRLTVPQAMAALRDLVLRARVGGLRSSELADPTVTVTSLGERGAESVFGVIVPPQVALIGIGRLVTGPAVVGDRVMPRPQFTLSLAADHRVSDGHLGSRLLDAIDRALQAPDQL